MPNIKQQKKRMRTDAVARQRNRQVKSNIRTMFRRLGDIAAEGDAEATAAIAAQLTARIDKAAAAGVIHKNNAAHKKSRVARIATSL